MILFPFFLVGLAGFLAVPAQLPMWYSNKADSCPGPGHGPGSAQHSLILPQSRFRPNENIFSPAWSACFSSGSKRKDYGKNIVVFPTILLRVYCSIVLHCFVKDRGRRRARERDDCRRNWTSLLWIASFHFIPLHGSQVRIARNGKEQHQQQWQWQHSGFFLTSRSLFKFYRQETRFWVSLSRTASLSAAWALCQKDALHNC